MNYRQLVSKISDETGISQQDVRLVSDAMARIIKVNVRQQKTVSVSGFGRFSLITMKPTRRRNIATGEIVDVPKRKSVRFYPSKSGFSVK